MIERLQKLIKGIVTQYSLDSATVMAVLFGGILFVANLIEPKDPQQWAALVLVGIGAIGLILGRIIEHSQAARLSFVLIACGFAFGLVILAQEALWIWWVTLIGFSLLPIIPDLRDSSVDFNLTIVYTIITLSALIVSLFISESISNDVSFLGITLLSTGHLLSILTYNNQTGAIVTRQALQPAKHRFEHTDELITQVHMNAEELVRSIQGINDVMQQQSVGAKEQAEVIRITSNLLDSFLLISERVHQQAKGMADSTMDTAQKSREGQQAIDQAINGMDQIRVQVRNIGMTIVTLTQLTKRIDEIITSVTEIATQSNLLALNASIEAARAGVHGRGFAVVADEVRSLSQQSTSAANQVRAILAEIQSAVKQTINATEIGMQGVDAGVTMTQNADTIMRTLAKTVESSTKSVRTIYDVIRQQAVDLEEITISMDRIDRITTQNLASTQMVSGISKNLSRIADNLQEIIVLQKPIISEEPALLDDDEE